MLNRPIYLIGILMLFYSGTFKTGQEKYPRVRKAYADKWEYVKNILEEHSIDTNRLVIYLRAFKQEKKIELWAKNQQDRSFKLIKEYTVCRTSGGLGPKRKQGDRQIPEGFYHINRFNPASNFYLSLGLNYPNASDKILADKKNPGGDIFIHGACVTIGCLPITNDKIKELYVFCVEARDNGQSTIPVTIFPAKLTASKFTELTGKYKNEPCKTRLWTDLKKGYDAFNKTNQLPRIVFLENGRHGVE